MEGQPKLRLLLYGIILQLSQSQAQSQPCVSSIQLSSTAISSLANTAAEVAAKYSLGKYKQVEPGVYEHYEGSRFLHKDTAGQWVYSSARDNDDMNRLQGTASECPEDTSVEWRWNKATTLERWRGESADTTFLVLEYTPVVEENQALLREVRQALGGHINATDILEETNNILQENQATNRELLDLLQSSLGNSTTAQSGTNTLLAGIKTSLDSSLEDMKMLSTESLNSNVLLTDITTSLEKSLEETKALTAALTTKTETAIQGSLDSNTVINEDTNSILKELKTSMEQSKQELTLAIESLLKPLIEIMSVTADYKKKEPTMITDVTMLETRKSSDLGSTNEYIFDSEQEEVDPEYGFGMMKLPSSYRKNKAPGSSDSPTEIRVVLQPLAITDISSEDKTVGLEMYMSLRWKDSRIEWNNEMTDNFDCPTVLAFSPEILRDLWTPDPVFKNQDSITKVESIILNATDSTFQVKKSCSCQQEEDSCQAIDFKDAAELIFNQTIKVLVDCPEMDFRKFPLDTQRCGFYLRDVGQDKNLVWLLENLDTDNKNNLVDSEFNINIGDKTIPSFAGFEMVMTRKPQVFVYTYFCPCSLMVIVSWVSFSVKADSVPGRLGLLLTLLLMLINLTNSAASNIPGSDSMCPLIVWIWMSIAFVMVALVEYFVILTIMKFSKPKVDVEPKPEQKNEKETNQKDPWEMVKGERSQETWVRMMDRGALFILPTIYFFSVVIFLLKNVD